jgi:2-oxo-4-hydroxy-4-carboxy-5-ureidoimidazoline decarboxylase
MPQQPGGPPGPAAPLTRFNLAPTADAVHTLLTCLRSPRWADRLAAHRPYPDLGSLLAAADEAAYDLTRAELAEALAAEPAPTLPESAYQAARTALGAAHAAYTARFGHQFAICLDGVPRGELVAHLLGAIRSRLTNDPDDERAITAEELRLLAGARLTAAFGPQGPDTGALWPIAHPAAGTHP